MQLDNKLHLQE